MLTSVGLEHTRWLGPTIADIAARSSTSSSRARRSCSGPACTPTRSNRSPSRSRPSAARRSSAPAPTPGSRSPRSGAFQRRNFAVARAAAEAYLGALDDRRGRRGRRRVRVPGRLQIAGERAADAARRRPQPRRDGGARRSRCRRSSHGRTTAGRRRLDPRRQGRRRDAGRAAAAGATRSSSPPATILARCRRPLCSRSPASSAARPIEIVRDAVRARSRARRELAGPDGRRRSRPARSTSCRPAAPVRSGSRVDAVNDERDQQPRFLTMVGIVALIVAVVILVFFGIGTFGGLPGRLPA